MSDWQGDKPERKKKRSLGALNQAAGKRGENQLLLFPGGEFWENDSKGQGKIKKQTKMGGRGGRSRVPFDVKRPKQTF